MESIKLQNIQVSFLSANLFPPLKRALLRSTAPEALCLSPNPFLMEESTVILTKAGKSGTVLCSSPSLVYIIRADTSAQMYLLGPVTDTMQPISKPTTWPSTGLEERHWAPITLRTTWSEQNISEFSYNVLERSLSLGYVCGLLGPFMPINLHKLLWLPNTSNHIHTHFQMGLTTFRENPFHYGT